MKINSLAVAAAGGDEPAIEELFVYFRPMLKSYSNLYYMVGADRDDVMQEGMVGLFLAIKGFSQEGGASFATFAEICIKRQILNAVKASSRKKHSPLNESVSFVSFANDDEGDPAPENVPAPSGEDDPEEMAIFFDLLKYLSEAAHEVFSRSELGVWRLYARGLSPAEISARLEKTPKQIDNALTRIKRKIETLVSAY